MHSISPVSYRFFNLELSSLICHKHHVFGQDQSCHICFQNQAWRSKYFSGCFKNICSYIYAWYSRLMVCAEAKHAITRRCTPAAFTPMCGQSLHSDWDPVGWPAWPRSESNVCRRMCWENNSLEHKGKQANKNWPVFGWPWKKDSHCIARFQMHVCGRLKRSYFRY